MNWFVKFQKKELKREQKREHVIAEYSISTDSGIENEKPQRKKKKKAKKVVRVKTKKHKKKSLGEREKKKKASSDSSSEEEGKNKRRKKSNKKNLLKCPITLRASQNSKLISSVKTY